MLTKVTNRRNQRSYLYKPILKTANEHIAKVSFAERAVAEMKYLSYRALVKSAARRTIKRKGRKEGSPKRELFRREDGVKTRRRDARRRYPRNKSPF